ncbi:MAG: WD40/YVTN/BNR-like repeat-containing protein, partial [Bacteroidales bacterium]
MKSFLLATLILFSIQIRAQDFWEEITRFKNINTALCVDHNTILFGGSINNDTSGLFVSFDGGGTWNYQHLWANSNIPTSYIGMFNDTYYAYVASQLYKSNDLVDWNAIGDVGNAGNLFILNDSTIFTGHWEGLDKSTDGGHTWERVYSTHPNESVETIVQHPNGDLFFGTYTFDNNAVPGVYRSTDTGETWERIGLERNQILSLAVDSNG